MVGKKAPQKPDCLRPGSYQVRINLVSGSYLVRKKAPLFRTRYGSAMHLPYTCPIPGSK